MDSIPISNSLFVTFYYHTIMSSGKYSKKISLLAKIALMLLAFWFVLRGIDMDELKGMLQAQNRSAFVEAGIFLLLQILLGAIRWRYVLSGLSGDKPIIPALSGLKTYYISVFFNCCLPGTVGGDVVRVWLVKSEHTPLPLAISSVVIDRMIALLALAVMGGLTLPFLISHSELNGWVIIPIFLLLFAIGSWLLFNLDKIILQIPFLKNLHWLESLLKNIRLMLSRPRHALLSLMYGIISHGTYCLAAYVLAQSLGASLSVMDALTLVPWVLLISIIPISIGGWGLREAAMVFMLGLEGVPQAAALALSVQLGLISIIISIPAGLLWLVNRKHAAIEK